MQVERVIMDLGLEGVKHVGTVGVMDDGEGRPTGRRQAFFLQGRSGAMQLHGGGPPRRAVRLQGVAPVDGQSHRDRTTRAETAGPLS